MHIFFWPETLPPQDIGDKVKIHTLGSKTTHIWLFLSYFVGYKKSPETQLPGRLISPDDICKKLSHHFLLHFLIGMGSYDHHAKDQGVFP